MVKARTIDRPQEGGGEGLYTGRRLLELFHRLSVSSGGILVISRDNPYSSKVATYIGFS